MCLSRCLAPRKYYMSFSYDNNDELTIVLESSCSTQEATLHC